jgi:ATP-binding cassette, subfamily B, bacterial MsbA
LLGYLRPYWKAFVLAIIGMVCTAATEPVFPAIMKYLLDHGFQVQDTYQVWLIPASIVALFIVRGILSFLTSYLMTWISTHLVTDLRRELFAKLLILPVQTFYEQSGGTLISRIMYDTSNVNQAATGVLVTTVRESLTAIALLVYLLYLDWKLTLVTLLVGPIIAFTMGRFEKRIRSASRDSFIAIQETSHTIEEAVTANKVIKIYGGQSQMTDRFFYDTERFRRSMMREAVPASALTPITHIAAALAIAVITYLALSQTTGQAGASAGSFVSFITAMLLLISPIKQLTTISPILQRGLAACEGVFTLLDTSSESDSVGALTDRMRGTVEFDNVHFSYPKSERQALSGITFQVEAGQTVALVGASGGGKTTIGMLVPRFYIPQKGTIKIDGVDISTLSLWALRSQIALVSQDIVLVHDTVAANIAFGQSNTRSRGEIERAAQAANAWDFVQQLPGGLDCLVGENGAKLSGGQRQRIAIARALLKDAPILILDEATSALDTESERQVQAALAVLMKGRTTLVIAHRLSTIEHADRILVLDGGQIVESGTHTSLVSANGYYANLKRLQT